MRILKEYVQYFLLEKAVSDEQVSNACLYVRTANNRLIFFLYDGSQYLNLLKKSYEQNHDFYGVDPPILGFLELNLTTHDNCYNASEITASAAIKGYGPLIYDIAMSMSPTKTVMSDRSRVSGAAKNVWNYYKNSRSDVEHKPFDDIDNPQTEPTIDDCRLHGGETGKDPLDFAYSILNGKNYGNLLQNHKKFLDIAASIDKEQASIIERLISQEGQNFFISKYNR